MGDTFNAFVKFISDDPIMLALCITIVILVIMFIIVLTVGRKKTAKNELVESNTDLLKTQVDLNALRSTQEFNLAELNGTNLAIQEQETFNVNEITPETTNEAITNSFEMPETEAFTIKEPQVMEVPVTTETPVALEVFAEETPNIFDVQTPDATQIEQVMEPVNMLVQEENIYAPQYTNTEPSFEPEIMVEQPTVENSFEVQPIMENNFDPQVIVEQPIVENTFEPQIMVTEPTIENVFKPEVIVEQPIIETLNIPLEPLVESAVAPIIESSVNPIENDFLENNLLDSLNVVTDENIETAEETLNENTVELQDMTVNVPDLEVELPTITAPIPTIEPVIESNSSIYLETNDFQPDFNIDDFDKTAVLKYSPAMDTLQTQENEPSNDEMVEEDSQLDDIDLPKLNDNNDTTALDILKGESFDIN